MYYISDITGVQTPYTQELLRAQRDQEAFEAASAVPEGSLSTNNRVRPHGEIGLRSIERNPAVGGAASSLHSSSGLNRIDAQEEGSSSARTNDIEAVSAIDPNVDSKKRSKGRALSPISIRHENPYAKLDEPQPERQPAVLAQQIMSSPVTTVRADQALEEATAIFQSHRFRHLPVLSSEGRLVGILSDRDALSLPDGVWKVSEVMTRGVLTARPQAEIREMARIMLEERIGAMPIVNEAHELVGILTRTDILRTVVHHAPLELWL